MTKGERSKANEQKRNSTCLKVMPPPTHTDFLLEPETELKQNASKKRLNPVKNVEASTKRVMKTFLVKTIKKVV